MKKKLLLAAFLISLSTPAAAGDWSEEDTKWQAAYLALHLIDWGQSRDAAAQPGRYDEQNPMLGEHPSQKRIDSYFAATAILHTAIAYALPLDWRRTWQHITIGVEAGVVSSNAYIGLQVNFK